MNAPSEIVAHSLELDLVLLPYAPELFADLEELGSNTELIVSVVRDLGLPRDGRAVDLGCGKGALALTLARRLDLFVFGVDLFSPFVDHCRQAARAAGLSDRCTFANGDIRTAAADHPDRFPADVVVCAALGDGLGSPENTIGFLRRCVTPGGYVVIADDYASDGADCTPPDGRRRKEILDALESHDDEVARVVDDTASVVAAAHREANSRVQHRARELGKRHPHLRDALTAFVESQRAETEFLQRHMVSAVWVVRRGRS